MPVPGPDPDPDSGPDSDHDPGESKQLVFVHIFGIFQILFFFLVFPIQYTNFDFSKKNAEF